MKPYVFLAIGAMWLIAVVVFVYRGSFNIVWLGNHDPALALSLFRVVIPVLFLGWVAPVLFGSWLLWRK